MSRGCRRSCHQLESSTSGLRLTANTVLGCRLEADYSVLIYSKMRVTPCRLGERRKPGRVLYDATATRAAPGAIPAGTAFCSPSRPGRMPERFEYQHRNFLLKGRGFNDRHIQVATAKGQRRDKHGDSTQGSDRLFAVPSTPISITSSASTAPTALLAPMT